MSDQEFDPTVLRTPVPAAGGLRAPLGADYGVDEGSELVVDLLAETQLVSPDQLALVRGRARQIGSVSRALVDEGVAQSEGIARMLAARHQLPLVDLAVTGVDEAAASIVPLHVLERVVAIPYGFEGETLKVAVADP